MCSCMNHHDVENTNQIALYYRRLGFHPSSRLSRQDPPPPFALAAEGVQPISSPAVDCPAAAALRRDNL